MKKCFFFSSFVRIVVSFPLSQREAIMGTERKGRAWFGKIYNKLETILVEVDNFTSQSTLCLDSSDLMELDSIKGEPKEVAEEHSSGTSDVQQNHDRVDSLSCKSPSDPPSHQNFDISGHARDEERVQGHVLKDNLVQGDSFKENLAASLLPDGDIFSTSLLLEDYYDANLTSTITLGDEEPIITDKESQVLPDTDTLFTSPFLEEFRDANLTSATTRGAKKPVIPHEESQITNSLTLPGKKILEEIKDVFGESQYTQSSLECFGTVLECKDDPILATFRTFMDDSNINPATKFPGVPVQENVANIRAFNADSSDDVINGNSDVALLNTNALHGIESREDPSYVDDSVLYAIHLRTQKLRSIKRKILDALTSKRRREKEYEQLAIWFGDADMGSDLATEEDFKQMEAIEFKSSQVLESKDSQWELL